MANKEIIVLHKEKGAKKSIWIVFGILVFAAIYVPFFGNNLRYQTGTMLKAVFTQIGTVFMFLGGVLIFFGILKLFMNRGISKNLLLGVLLLWIGAFMTGTAFDLFGFAFGGSTIPQGYH